MLLPLPAAERNGAPALAQRPWALTPLPADSVLGGSPHRDATNWTEPVVSRHLGESRLQAAQAVPAAGSMLYSAYEHPHGSMTLTHLPA
jgi:hypothetical protein